MKKPRVLIVEDEFITAMDLQTQLEDLGYLVNGRVQSAEEALSLVRSQPFDLILMDIMLRGEKTGIEAASEIRSEFRTPVIYLTATTAPQLLAQAKTSEPFGFLMKPFQKNELRANIEMALYKHEIDEGLRKNEEKYRQLVELADDAIAVVQDDVLKFTNSRVANLSGYSQTELRSAKFLNFIHPDDLDMVKDSHTRRLQGEELPSSYPARIVLKDGSTKWVEFRAIQIEWEERPAILVFFTDITKRKEAEVASENYKNQLEELVAKRTAKLEQEIYERKCIEENLRQAKENALQSKDLAEAANIAKSAFVANMSHELRTPLNGILGYAQILQCDPQLNEEQRAQIDIIRTSGEHLLILLNDILDLSKLEAEKLKLQETAFYLSDILKPLIHMVQLETRKKGLHFEYEKSPGLLYAFHGDAMRLRQVLFNLLGNAVKFTEEGMVSFRVRRAADHEPDSASAASRQLAICFEVEDTGVGIPPEQREKIFTPFSQYAGSRLYTEGPGLGLTLCQRLLHLMGSTLQVSSTQGQGSLFWFRLLLTEIKDTDIDT